MTNVVVEQKRDMLKDKLREDSIVALKSGNQRLVDTLRFLISLIDKKEMQMEAGKMTEADEIQVLRKELKNKEESKEMFLKGNRDDLVTQVEEEIKVVKSYLPAEISEDDVRKVVEEIVASGETNFGLVMKKVMEKLAGQVDGAVVSKMVKEKLNG